MIADKDALLEWFAFGDTGVSSEAIATYCGLGKPVRDVHSHPRDPADLNRCIKLLKAVPELSEHLHKMADVSTTWARMVERWYEMESMFLYEVGFDWRDGRSAPKTYELMRSILGDGKVDPGRFHVHGEAK